MNLIKIVPNSNGSHDNMRGVFSEVLDGYAVIPKGMAIPESYPFVDIITNEEIAYKEVENCDGVAERVPYKVHVVVDMIPLEKPTAKPIKISTEDRLNALESSFALIKGIISKFTGGEI